MHEELRDVSAVRLVRRRREHDLDGPDDRVAEERSEEQAPVSLDVLGPGRERLACLLVRERRHVADGRATRDAVGEHGREPVEPLAHLGRIEAANVDSGRAVSRHAVELTSWK